MAKPNYAFAKRQKELAKKKKQEEKRRLKAEARGGLAAQESPQPSDAESDAD